ncbi:MAG: hypothetical protein KDH96_02275 [Candidatus Riesia sp.]|nr:hypothetical protein [Candidatus Riesia sp.]
MTLSVNRCRNCGSLLADTCKAWVFEGKCLHMPDSRLRETGDAHPIAIGFDIGLEDVELGLGIADV